MSTTKKAVVLLSGGLDSTTVLAVAQRDGYRCHALSFEYGQRHEVEIEAARRVAAAFEVERHVVARIDLRAFGGSALTADVEVPKGRSLEDMEDGTIPITYVPARNTIFLSYALAFAETLEASDIFIGVNALDYSGYPDCRPAFIDAFQEAARLGTRGELTVHAPLAHSSKADIVKLGVAAGAPLHLTTSCYLGQQPACGACDACQLRLKGFAAAGIPDPIPYRHPLA